MMATTIMIIMLIIPMNMMFRTGRPIIMDMRVMSMQVMIMITAIHIRILTRTDLTSMHMSMTPHKSLRWRRCMA